ncbi:unnamed protein product [Camellia sinensis]
MSNMAKSQNSKFKCFSSILRYLLCISSLPTQPSDPTTDIPTTTTFFENPTRNFKTQVKTPRVVTRLMGLDSLPDPGRFLGERKKVEFPSKCMLVTMHVDGRPPNVIAKLMGLDGLPPQQPLHRQHKGFSETYRQRTASVSSQRDGKPYELQSIRKDSMAQKECKDEYEVFETSKVERSCYRAKRTVNSKLSEAEMAFIQQKFMADHGLVGKPYEHRSNKKDSMAQQECKDEYEVFETSKIERSSYPAKTTINSKLSEAEMAFIQQKFMADHGTSGQVLECLDNENLEHLAMMESLRAVKYFKRSARSDWLEDASSKESARAVWKLPRLQ